MFALKGNFFFDVFYNAVPVIMEFQNNFSKSKL